MRLMHTTRARLPPHGSEDLYVGGAQYCIIAPSINHLLYHHSHLSNCAFIRIENQYTMSGNPNWRPVVLRPWYLALVILLSIALGVGMEYTYQHYKKNENSSLFEFHDDLHDLTLLQYFVWRMLLPLIIMVWGGFIALIDIQLVRMAPFYQLASKSGLSGSDALLRYPDSYWSYLRNPGKTSILGWISLLNMILAEIIASVVQSVVFISTNPPDTSLTGEAYTEAASLRVSNVVIRSVGSRMLSATFFLVGLCCLSVAFILSQRPSGVAQDPGGVCCVASLLPPQTALRLYNYNVHDDLPLHLNGGFLANWKPSNSLAQTKEGSSHISWLPLSTMIFGFFLCIFCGVSTYTNLVWYIRRVLWLIPLFAVLFKLLWMQFDKLHRAAEPARQLAKRRPARPINLFIDYTGIAGILLPFLALQNRHWKLCMTGMASMLAELLVTAITCSVDISSYMFIETQTNNAGTPMEEKSSYLIRNGPVYTLFLCTWIYALALLFAISLWLLLLLCVLNDGLSQPTPRDPAKLGVILGWVVGTDLLQTLQGMRAAGRKVSLEEFNKSSSGGKRWQFRKNREGAIVIDAAAETHSYEMQYSSGF